MLAPLRAAAFALAVAAVPSLTTAVSAQESEPSEAAEVTGSLDTTVASLYLWRGARLTDDEPVVQLAGGISVGGLTASVWSNFELLDGLGRQAEFTEVDLGLDYTHAFGDVSLSVGLLEYLFPAGVPSTREVYLTVGYDWIVSPSVSVYYDFGEVDGLYASLALGYSYELMATLSLDAGASIGFGDGGYNAVYWGDDRAALNDVNVSVGTTWQATDRVSVAPMLQFTTLLDGDIADATDAGGQSHEHPGCGNGILRLLGRRATEHAG